MGIETVFSPGDKYGQLTIVSVGDKTKYGGHHSYKCFCKCDCGGELHTYTRALRMGVVKCCLNTEHYSGKNNPMFKNGKTNTKEYRTWLSIKERCYNPKNKSYHSYGQKGITMCETFLNSFDKFLEEVGTCPSSSHSIDRIDPKIGYFPGNLRWTTSEYQARNKGKTCLNSTGVTGVIFAWSGKTGHTTYVEATWRTLDKKNRKKSFSVKKLGLMVAFRNAVMYREKMVQELNTNGAGYTENHGK